MPRLFHRGGMWGAASWIALALVGLVVAAGVSIAASKLTRQHIGISSEPLSAARDLAPATTTTPSSKPTARPHKKHTTTAPTPVTPAPTPVTPTPVTPAPPTAPTLTQPRHGDDSGGGKDDSGGSHSGGGGHGGDD